MILAVASVGAILASCNKSDVQVGVTGKPNKLPVTISLSAVPLDDPSGSMMSASETKTVAKENEALSVTYGGPHTKTATALTSAEDSKVYNVWAIQFKADGSLLGTPYYTTDIPAPGTAAGFDASYSVSVNLTANTEAGGKVYFIANTNSPTTFNSTNAATETALAAVMKSISSQWAPTAAGGVPMLGVYTGAVSSSAALSANVTLKRLIAKVIFKYKVNSTFAGFEINSVQLKNVASNIYYCNVPSNTVIFPAKNVTAGKESHLDYTAEDLTKAGADGDYKTFLWYIPENIRGVNSTVTDMGNRTLDKTDGMATYVEVKGTLLSATKCEKATYAILLGNPTSAKGNFNVERNNVYTVSVDIQGPNTADKRITVESFDMSNAAILKPNSGAGGAVTFDIRKCTANGFTTAAALKGMLGSGSTLTADVLWQDGNVINSGDVSLDKDNGLLTVKSSKATEGNAIVALYPNTSKTQGSILWSWHIWVTSYDPDAIVAANNINTKDKAYTASGVSGQVHTYGEAYWTKNSGRAIMDRNLGATSTYYDAPASATTAAAQDQVGKCFGMFYQWGRKDPFPPVQGSTIVEASATGTTIPIYGPNGTSVLTEGAKDDPVPAGYKQVSVATAGGAGPNIPYAVKNPLTFIYNGGAPYDWYTSTNNNTAQNNDLWGDGAQKSDYDPCPKGWRIGPNGTWSDFTRTSASAGTFLYWEQGVQSEAAKYYATNGRRYVPAGSATSLTWYPAPGGRGGGEGALWNVGGNGYGWSSSVSGTYGLYLNFSATYLNPGNTAGRADGLQVRCLQE